MPHFFFNPKTIAVIGATANPKKFGNAVTINILKNKNLKCKLFLVTQNSKEIMGIPCFQSILDISEEIELAIILVPAKTVNTIINECITRKVKRIIIVTAGFGEINDEGKQAENLIADKCRANNIRIMGPNCVGIQNTEIGLNASFIQAAPHGNISMISQSGSFGCASFYAMERENIGCLKFANIGNNVDISFVDILDYFNNDSKTKLISIYMETITQGRKFLELLKKVILKKPVIVLKGGRSPTGMKAASSHTGSLASNYKILKAAIRQTGATLCESASDFIVALKTFSFLPIPQGEKIGVLTNSGGSSVLFSDKVEEFGFTLVEFSKTLREKIRTHLISLVKFVNPLDMIGVAGELQYYEVTKAMLEDPDIDIVVPCLVIPPFLEMRSDEHYRGMIRAWNDTNRKKPIIPLIFFGESFEELKKYALKENSPIFYTPQEAAFATKIIVERFRILSKKL